MKVISSLDCVEVIVEKESVKVYYKDGTIEICHENKQIIIKDINVKYCGLYKQKGDKVCIQYD